MALAVSLLIGLIFGVLLLVSAFQRNGLGALITAAAIVVFVAPCAIVSHALSRPSAKAWFAPPEASR